MRSISAPADNLRRVIVHSLELLNFQLTGPDEFFGLLMPPMHGDGTLHLPELPDETNIRALVADMPETQRPSLRWYTIRAIDPDAGELAFDVATHGATSPHSNTPGDEHLGPGLSWVLSAQAGSEVGLWICQGHWHQGEKTQTLIADPSSTPALQAILQYTELFAPSRLGDMHVIVVAETPQDLQPGFAADWEAKLGSLKIFLSPASSFSSTVCNFLRHLDATDHPATHSRYVWVEGEGDLSKDVRGHAVKNWGLPSDSVHWCPYWFLGRARP